MPKYLLSYHGGDMPATPEEGDKVMAAWGKWMEELGPALIDGGNPTGPSKTIAADGRDSEGGGENPVTGYSVIEAADMDAAVKLAKGCPHLAAHGTIEVGQLIDMG